MDDYRCSKCDRVLEHIGVPPAIRMAQMYGQVSNIGSAQVPDEVRSDPYVYRGLYCSACNRVFCPSCSNMQGEVCTGCGSRQLMPAYRPLLKRLGAQTQVTQTVRKIFLSAWTTWSFVPGLSWVSWVHASIRARSVFYLGLSVPYAAPVFLSIVLTPKGQSSPQWLAVLNALLWPVGIIHVQLQRRAVNRRIESIRPPGSK